jgi:serine/threonine-protein kinase
VTDPLDALRAALDGRYTIERLVGQGGMATVYLAQDSRHDRPVAIKVLRPELSASIGSDRFLREIKVAAHLQHPNILALYDSGEAGSFLYYVMPFIQGESLRARLVREGQLSMPDAIQLTCEVADALQYAHSKGIVHRDIKPENILIQEGHALVADFGIARAVSQAGGEKLTESGMAVGTPHYMSPEQALGGDHVDGRSDEYSLACVVYEMLVGQPPFSGPNAMAILARHSMEAVPSLQVVRHAIPDEVENAVMRALEKTPADRFPTVREFSDALLQADLGPTARRTSPRAIQAIRRTARETPAPAVPLWRRRGVWAAALGGLVLLAGVGWTVRSFLQRSGAAAASDSGGLDPHRVAVLYFDAAGQKDSLGYLADGLTEGLIDALSEVQTLDVISKNGVAPFRGDSITRDSVARALKAGTLVQGSVEKESGKVRVTMRLVDGGSGAEFQRASFEQPSANLLAIKDTMIQEVAGLIRRRLGEEIKLREQQRIAANPQAWALVQRAEQSRKRAEELVTKQDTTGAANRAFDQADTLYAQAHVADPKWTEPLVGRATLGYRRSRLVGLEGLAAKPWIDKGLKYAEEALALDPRDPDALEARGTLHYWSWLLSLEPDRAKAKALLASSQSDLEAAVKVRPSQASAWAILSHLYVNAKSETDGKLAARRAYEEDAYLSNADQVINRLFLISYDLSQFVDANYWCQEGQRRFPGNYLFIKCQLYMMTSKAQEPDVALAARLADSVPTLAPPGRRDFEGREAQMLRAMVLARAGQADSARQVSKRARAGGPDVDPSQDLAWDAIYVSILTGDKDEALKALKSYLTSNPQRREGLAEDPGWWFRGIQDDPRFQELVRSK